MQHPYTHSYITAPTHNYHTLLTLIYTCLHIATLPTMCIITQQTFLLPISLLKNCIYYTQKHALFMQQPNLSTTTDTYHDQTVNVIIDQLRIILVDVLHPSERAAIWHEWVGVWSQFPFNGFLQSSKDSIVQQVPPNYRVGLDKLDGLLPWPDAAITAYSTYSYTTSLDTSLVEVLREVMGQWWSPHMHHIDGGMSELPNAFYKNGLKDNVEMNFSVTKIRYKSTDNDLHHKVVVKGFRQTKDGKWKPLKEEGNAVIVTTPVNILRQIKFVPIEGSGGKDTTPPLPDQFYKSIEDIWYGPSTKIMLQTKTRFWETKYGIQGGFTKTNLPIGQIHYPSNPGFHAIPDDIKEGILLCYTWKSEALMFGALPPTIAIYEAVDQIAQIHPEITDQFEKGAIQAWYNDPAAQGAYALLKPRQVENVQWLMYPWRNVYFAGEAISFANGWIQGAMESGLRAAYQFYARNENAAK